MGSRRKNEWPPRLVRTQNFQSFSERCQFRCDIFAKFSSYLVWCSWGSADEFFSRVNWSTLIALTWNNDHSSWLNENSVVTTWNLTTLSTHPTHVKATSSNMQSVCDFCCADFQMHLQRILDFDLWSYDPITSESYPIFLAPDCHLMNNDMATTYLTEIAISYHQSLALLPYSRKEMFQPCGQSYEKRQEANVLSPDKLSKAEHGKNNWFHTEMFHQQQNTCKTQRDQNLFDVTKCETSETLTAGNPCRCTI